MISIQWPGGVTNKQTMVITYKQTDNTPSLGEGYLVHMLDIPGPRPQGHLEGVVDAAGHQLQVLVGWVCTCAWHVQIGEDPVHVETRPLAEGCGTKDPDHWDPFDRTGPEVGVADV